VLKRALPVAVPLLVVAAIVAVVLATNGGKGTIGARAPELPRTALVGPPLTIAQLSGRPVVVNFWAAWCGPCRKEAPQLRHLASVLGGRARLIGVDWSDNTKNARAFIARSHWTYPNFSDPDGKVGDSYGIQGLPTTFVLDASGHIRAALRGPQTERSIEAALARYTRA
jgi:cytochrome c biogenesis protein CcmG/thiol:disulfide interchange protein DsbE